jgi:integrase/recombinase XerD
MARLTDTVLFEQFIDDLKKQDRTQRTIESYGSSIRIFQEYLHSRKCSFLSVDGWDNKELLEDFLVYLREVRKLSYGTIKDYYCALNSFYGFLSYRGYIKQNMVLDVRKRYVHQFKNGYTPAERKIIDVDEMSRFLNGITELRAKVVALLFVKTGVRRGELIHMDVDDIDFMENSITLKPIFRKRTNTTVYFDEETAIMLKRWLKRRETLVGPNEKALFVSDFGTRLQRRGIYDCIVKWATILGYNNVKSDKIKDHFTVHNLRHCFTTYLSRAGMPRNYIQELRGDKHSAVVDLYTHIDKKDLRKSYLSFMPKFNVY